MARWQRTLKLKDVWEIDNDDPQEVALLSKIVAQRLRALKPFPQVALEEKKEYVAQLFDALGDGEPDVQEFDEALQSAYEWADTRLDNHFNGAKVCWIETQ
jgi:hypothetical protein